MEKSSQHEDYTGHDATGGGPSVSNTNASGLKHTCQSCGITASGSKPSGTNTASGPELNFLSGSESANPSARGPEPAFSGHEDGPRGSNTTNLRVRGSEPAFGGHDDAPRGVNNTSFIPSGVNAASSIPSGANTARFTPSPSGPEPTRLIRTHSANPGDSNTAAPQTAPAPRTHFDIMTETPEETAYGLATFRNMIAGLSTAELRAEALFRILSDGPSYQDPETPPESESRKSLE
jgi:hypothetical protein